MVTTCGLWRVLQRRGVNLSCQNNKGKSWRVIGWGMAGHLGGHAMRHVIFRSVAHDVGR